MNTITAFTCVRDGIDFIEAWFENVKQADAIVIQDGGSRDGTVEKLLEFQSMHPNVKLLLDREETKKYEWNEEIVRNQCLGLFKTDWILYTDCDELVDDQFWEWAREVDHEKKIAYYIPHRNLWMTKDMFNMAQPWYPDLTIRFFKNHSGLFWVGAEHGSLWHMSGMLSPNHELCAITPNDIHVVHYHRWEEGYYDAVMEDRIPHHSDEKNKINEVPLLIRLRKHPTGAGLIKKHFGE